MPHSKQPVKASTSDRSSHRGWKLFLVLPYIGLCFPGMYSRLTPAFLGFPFFYWYQFLWVVLTSLLLGLLYLKLKDRDE